MKTELTSFIHADEIAEKFKVTRQTLRNWDKCGKLKAHRVGREPFYLESDILKALQS